MRKRLISLNILFVIVVSLTLSTTVNAGNKHKPKPKPVVYVTSQDRYYDSVVLTDLPPSGSFQLLEMAGPTGRQTEFGLGDSEYVGGRWWVDANQDGEMDSGDFYFYCPLIGASRSEP